MPRGHPTKKHPTHLFTLLTLRGNRSFRPKVDSRDAISLGIHWLTRYAYVEKNQNIADCFFKNFQECFLTKKYYVAEFADIRLLGETTSVGAKHRNSIHSYPRWRRDPRFSEDTQRHFKQTLIINYVEVAGTFAFRYFSALSVEPFLPGFESEIFLSAICNLQSAMQCNAIWQQLVSVV